MGTGFLLSGHAKMISEGEEYDRYTKALSLGKSYYEHYYFNCYTNCLGKTMRRAEFEVNDKQLIEEVLATCEHGTLCLVDEGEPYSGSAEFCVA